MQNGGCTQQDVQGQEEMARIRAKYPLALREVQ
jgi:hypothetical protein